MDYALDWRFDAETFGPDCPENWEEIADFLNKKLIDGLEEKYNVNGCELDLFWKTISDELDDMRNEVWDKFLNDEYPDAPAPVMG